MEWAIVALAVVILVLVAWILHIDHDRLGAREQCRMFKDLADNRQKEIWALRDLVGSVSDAAPHGLSSLSLSALQALARQLDSSRPSGVLFRKNHESDGAPPYRGASSITFSPEFPL